MRSPVLDRRSRRRKRPVRTIKTNNQQGVVVDLNIPPLNRELRNLHGDLPWLIYESDSIYNWLADRDI